MGVQGLLGALKPITVQTHISAFKGQTVAVDAYVWLHRAVIGCAQELVTGQCHPKRYVDYCMHRVRMLTHHGVRPIIVFDGGHLPAKAHTESERRTRRKDALAKAQSLMSQGLLKAARDCYIKAVDVSPQYAYQFIKALKKEGIDFIVAPYEADAQMAFLAANKVVSAIITEDSDLMVFSTTPQDQSTVTIIYKLMPDGHGLCLNRSRLGQVPGMDMTGWTDEIFRSMAILSGCDYLPGLPGVGIKSAHRLLRKVKDPQRAIKMLRLEHGISKVPENYELEFQRAELTFRHQRVWDPLAKRLCTLQPLPPHLASEAMHWHFIGQPMDDTVAQGIAEGRLCPFSKEPIQDIWPEYLAPGSSTGLAYSETAAMCPPSEQGSKTLRMIERSSSSKSLLTYFSRVSTPAKTTPAKSILDRKNESQVERSAKRMPLRNVTNEVKVNISSEARTISRYFAQTPAKPAFLTAKDQGDVESDLFLSPERHTGFAEKERVGFGANAPEELNDASRQYLASEISSPSSSTLDEPMMDDEAGYVVTPDDQDEDLRLAIAASLQDYRFHELPFKALSGDDRDPKALRVPVFQDSNIGQVPCTPSPLKRRAFDRVSVKTFTTPSGVRSNILVTDSSPNADWPGKTAAKRCFSTSNTAKARVKRLDVPPASHSKLNAPFMFSPAFVRGKDKENFTGKTEVTKPTRSLFDAFRCPQT